MPYLDPITKSTYNKNYLNIYYEINKEAERQRIYDRKNAIKKWYREYKSNFVCNTCGIKDDLEFHHIDPNTKFKDVCRMVTDGYKKERIMEEMEKCVLLCRKCHDIITYKKESAARVI